MLWSLINIESMTSLTYIYGCLVASLTPSHPCTGWGRANLRGPTGGLAKGTPRYEWTTVVFPLTRKYSPLRAPSLVWISGPVVIQTTTPCSELCLLYFTIES